MKKILQHILCLGFFMSLLFSPETSLEGAKQGLLLWYTIILPTLLPFIICTNLLISTNAFSLLVKILGKPIRKLFKLSENATFAVIIGFLCGYPMGAKVSCDLYKQGSITRNEALYLLTFCNNPSPVFISSILITQMLREPKLLLITLTSILLAPCILSLFTRKYYSKKNIYIEISSENPKLKNNNILESSIIDGINLIVKIGGYIMLFSIFIALAKEIPMNLSKYSDPFLPYLECTNGLNICNNITSFKVKYLSMLSVISFGGICAIAQTQCLLTGTDLTIRPYIITKIITAILTVIIGYFLLIIYS